jgi:small-conductance mechanosensitive channel
MRPDLIQSFRDLDVYGISATDIAIAAFVTLATFAALQTMRWIVLRQLVRVSGRTRTCIDDVATDVIRRTKVFFIAFVSLYAGAQSVALPSNVAFALRVIGVLLVTVQIALWGNALIGALLRVQLQKRAATEPGTATTITAAGYVARTIFYVVLTLLALDNLGVQVGALITTLGIGGIAVALALQNVLGDLFGSLSIVLDKPFVVGDFIVVGDMSGTVEHVGLKTTRLRSLSGEQLIFANSDLLGARIRNYQRMNERRVAFTTGVTYETPRDVLAAIPAMIETAVTADPTLRFDRSHIKAYGPYSIDYETVYYIPSSDYTQFMESQQRVLLAIHELLEGARVSYAYPTQTLYVENQLRT